jgi:hypothetical protein
MSDAFTFLSVPLRCCGARLVFRRGKMWICPCGKQHSDEAIRKMKKGGEG